ncbi:efflux RND transporter periplasmic adaptor subunit [Thalassotalea sp. Y01]|uniref:efflux RND transporter periplasmic adaptor subunit n=1 Tax=Thalassotalea sp. Y01 TaxID=2729613 RepID=UPI0020070A91|nr:efflux RND transporter periplasmic adaptor subunit [Thalassotalea sp. Y01]
MSRGEVIYTLVDTESVADLENIEADIKQLEVKIAQHRRDIQRSVDAPGVFAERDIERIKTELDAEVSAKEALQAEYDQAMFEQSRKTVIAPFDGQVSITNIAKGSRLGNMHIYDTSRKFLEMRIPDQSYRYIKKGQFAEFYVNAYPGEIFRGRVHSITAGTGEAQLSVRSGEQMVGQHIGQNAPSHGRTVVIEFIEPEGYNVPIGATGSGWISATKPHPILGFMDIIGAATVRLKAYKAYLNAL